MVDEVQVCGDVEAWQMIVRCECGLFRQADKPHAHINEPPFTLKELEHMTAQRQSDPHGETVPPKR